jgi:hypothetical protein
MEAKVIECAKPLCENTGIDKKRFINPAPISIDIETENGNNSTSGMLICGKEVSFSLKKLVNMYMENPRDSAFVKLRNGALLLSKSGKSLPTM